MNPATVRSRCSLALSKRIVYNEREFLDIVEVHQVPDLLWLAKHRDITVRVRAPLSVEVEWLKLAAGATVAIAVTEPGVTFTYFAGAAYESELVAEVVQFFPPRMS